MCGIAGVWSRRQPADDAELRRMADALRRRGPDDAGVWRDDSAGVGLAHRRLSIIDLSPAGHQPMISAGGRYVLTYNGEIYNFGELRAELEALAPRAWAGHSDTEVLLAGFEQWGLRDTLARANGMFALAVWDRQQRVLSLARDRFGEKPLYFGWLSGRFVFASETKALARATGWRPRIDPAVAARFAQMSYVEGPRSLITGLFRLPPGTLLTLPAADTAQDWPALAARLDPYWKLPDVVVAARRAPPRRWSLADAGAELEALLRESVRLRMVADVPVGALLSGGVDSSTVVALMQAISPGKVRTFSAGFREAKFDEAPHAAAIARHLGTEHVELYVNARDALDLIPTLPDLYDEPFADSSQIPTTLIAGAASRHVKVALTGDGGDELFGGYHRYPLALRAWRATGWLPGVARRGLAGTLRSAGAAGAILDRLQPGRDAGRFRLQRLAWRLSADSIDQLRVAFMCGMPLGDGVAAPLPAEHERPPDELRDPFDRMRYSDQVGYLPDDILTKVDRASMHWSLETRIPLLDPRIAEFAWRQPRAALDPGRKPLLKSVLARHVPPALTERPKQGFEIPLADWLRGPLRDWVESCLAPARVRAAGVLDEAALRRTWSAHLARRSNSAPALWNALMLLAWCERTGATV